MRSRILIGGGAWLLGVVTATAGSMYAVDQLAQGLLSQQSKQVSVAMVNAELARESADSVLHPQGQATPAATAPAGGGNAVGSTGPRTSDGQLLTSPDGNAVAACRPAGPYLVYWSPQPGYEATHVVRGSGTRASVTFRNSSGGLVLSVTCQDGQPVARTWPLRVEHDD